MMICLLAMTRLLPILYTVSRHPLTHITALTGYNLETAIASVLRFSPRCLSLAFAKLAPNLDNFSNRACNSRGLTRG